MNYYDTGYKAYRSGDYETAIENLTKAVSYDEVNSEALFYALANPYRDNGNKRQAKETYQKVIELFPNTEKQPSPSARWISWTIKRRQFKKDFTKEDEKHKLFCPSFAIYRFRMFADCRAAIRG